MSKLAGLACTTMLLLLAATSQSDKYSKYKAVEAYEVRPGILMMPRYSSDGQVCEIGLERRHYSPEKVALDSGLSRKEIDQIADEIVPADERGPKTTALGGRDQIVEAGHTLVTYIEYENVLIQIYGGDSPKCNEGNVAATIRWTNRKCQADSPRRVARD